MQILVSGRGNGSVAASARVGVPTGAPHICLFPAIHTHKQHMENSARSWVILAIPRIGSMLVAGVGQKDGNKVAFMSNLGGNQSEVASNQIIR